MERTKEILLDSAKSLKHSIKYILLLILLVSLPVALIQAYVVDARFDMSGTMSVLEEALTQYEQGGEFTAEGALTDAASKMLVYFALTMLLSSFSLILHIGVMLTVRNHRNGTPSTFRDIFEHAIRLFPKVWLTQILASILMTIGFLFCFLPGVFMYFVFYMVPYSVVYTELWGRKGLFVSSLYSRKYGRKVLGMILFGIIFNSLSGMGVSALVGILPTGGTVGGGISAASYCLQDLLSCVPVLFFSGLALAMPLEIEI